MKIIAIVLAAGSGSRMGTNQKKQYLLLEGKPILYYSLKAFEDSQVDEIVLVTGEEAYCRKQIIEPFGLTKVKQIVHGGKERYHSVYQGLLAATGSDYVLIHDGARPFISQDIITRSIQGVQQYQACVTGMPVKDTIKEVNLDGSILRTLDRSRLYQIQTPQSFSYQLILEAYEQMKKEEWANITDDGMLIEYLHTIPVKTIAGSYKNIKITTYEDLQIGGIFLK